MPWKTVLDQIALNFFSEFFVTILQGVSLIFLEFFLYLFVLNLAVARCCNHHLRSEPGTSKPVAWVMSVSGPNSFFIH